MSRRLVPTYNEGNQAEGQQHGAVDPRRAMHPTCPARNTGGGCSCTCPTCRVVIPEDTP